MTIELISNRGQWDDFVESSPAGLLFHRWDFLKIIEKYSGFKLFPFGIYKGTELICLLPLFYRKANGLKLLYSPPQQKLAYVPYGGFVTGAGFAKLKQHKKESYLDIIIDGLEQILPAFAPDRVAIASGTAFGDVRNLKLAGYDINVGYTYVNDLRPPIDKIWDGLHQTCRTSIRAKTKQPMTIKECCQPEAFFEVMKSRLSWLGTTFFHAQRPVYLREIMERFPDNVRMRFLYDGDDLVDAAVTCEFKDRVLLWMQGSNVRSGDYGEYLHWELIKDARDRGFSAYENWGTWEKRLNQFKSKFNPEPVIHFAVTRDSFVGSLAQRAYSGSMKMPLIGSLAKKLI